MTDTNKLKELAERATPGPWQADQLAVTADTRTQVCCGQAYMECCGDPEIEGEEFDPVCSATSEPLADFIAAANPQAILGLIAEVERLREKHAETRGRESVQRTLRTEAEDERDRLKAENEALKDKLSDCAISLHGEMMQKYGGQPPEDMHPVTRRDYERDMAEIAEYMAALEGGGR